MDESSMIEVFLKERRVAVAGVSRSGKKFGNTIHTELAKRGYTVYPINPHAEEIDGSPCYPSITALPDDVGGIVTVVPPDQSLEILHQAQSAGIRKVWLQPGSQSAKTAAAARELGLQAVHGRCLLMFLEPVESVHRMHRFFARLFGTYPRRSA